MAKGGYMCIGYPDKIELAHCTLDSIVHDASKMGAETCYIFHDKDVAEPHYHFIFMWRRSVTVWDDQQCKHTECVNNCNGCKFFNFIRFMELHGLKAPKKGTSIVFDYATAVIKDIDSALDYMLHN